MPVDLLAFGLAVALAAGPPRGSDDGVEGAPPVALLEFLGLWTTDDGRWVDPELLDALPDEAMEGGMPAPEAPGTEPGAEAPEPGGEDGDG